MGFGVKKTSVLSQFYSMLALSPESFINFVYEAGIKIIVPIPYYKIHTVQRLHKSLSENVLHSVGSLKLQLKINVVKHGSPT